MSTIRTDIRRVTNNFDNAIDRKITSIYLYSERFARTVLEKNGKLRRPWQDRTSNARQGLKGSATREGNKKIYVRFSHSVSYGKHLEKMQAGKYAVIKPTMDLYKRGYISRVRQYWGR